MKSKTTKKITRSLKSTAYHEAGHAVLKFEFDLKIEKVTIVRDGDCLGSVKGKRAVTSRQVDKDNFGMARLKAEKDVMVMLAGGIAQKKFDPKTYKRDHCRSDFQSAWEMLSFFSRSEKETVAYREYLKLRTENFIVCRPYRWKMIQAVAEELLLRQTLTGQQVKEAIWKMSSDWQPGAV